MKYEFLEHTADVKFRAYGKTLEEAFANALLATAAVMAETTEVKEARKLTISVNAENKEALLYDFLEEFIVQVNTEQFLPASVESIEISGDEGNYILDAVVLGDDLQDYQTHDDVKAVTYNSMEIHDDEGDAWVQVVLDI